MTAPDKISLVCGILGGWALSLPHERDGTDVEYTRTSAHPVTVEMLEYWHSVMSNGIAADQIRAAIAAIKEMK